MRGEDGSDQAWGCGLKFCRAGGLCHTHTYRPEAKHHQGHDDGEYKEKKARLECRLCGGCCGLLSNAS